MSDNATAVPEPVPPAPAAGSHRPDYGRPGRDDRRPGACRRWILPLAGVLLAAAVGVGMWGHGRGYKTALFRQVFPDDPRYLTKPTVAAVRPADREGGVPPDAFIAADVNLPNPGRTIDKGTIEGSVLLLKGNAREKVPAVVNTSGGGDAIVLRPLRPLELNALYTFEVLPALKDTGGAAFEGFSSSFSTAAGTVYAEFPAAAAKAEQPTSFGQWYTGLAFGPDGKLYASTLAGQILRFAVAADGSLSAPQMITTVLAANRGPRLMTGITFDPAATPDNLVAYVAHGTFPYGDRQVESAAPTKSRGGGTPHGLSTLAIPDWSSKITRLSGPDLERAEDLVVGLPRARHDHTTGQIAFGPDGRMYFAQASNTAMGAPDHKWGLRPERLLTTCVMRLDLDALAGRPAPLNVQTEEGGSYDPFAPAAPLTIHATGTRNCYDLLFHSNGRLYATLNGSAAGGNTPGTRPDGRDAGRRVDAASAGPYDGPAVPARTGVGTQNDYLLRVEPGGYYGHPNPTRAEFVMNGGNPSAARDACEVAEYPVGTPPDRNWRRPAFDFNKNLSPCGLVEYAGDAFPSLRGRMLVVRFSGGKDVVALAPGPDGDVREVVTGLDGFTRFHDPVDLCVAPGTGFLYVAEHTGKKITLLRPTSDNVSKRAIRQVVSAPGALPPPPPARQAPLPVVRSTNE